MHCAKLMLKIVRGHELVDILTVLKIKSQCKTFFLNVGVLLFLITFSLGSKSLHFAFIVSISLPGFEFVSMVFDCVHLCLV